MKIIENFIIYSQQILLCKRKHLKLKSHLNL